MVCKIISVDPVRRKNNPDKPGFFYGYTTDCSNMWERWNSDLVPVVGEDCCCNDGERP